MKKILFAFAAMLLNHLHMQAAILRVNNTPGMLSVYTSITAALTAAQPGDTLHLEGSLNSYGSIYVTKRLIITGPGYFFSDTAATPQTQANRSQAILELSFGPGSKGSVVQGTTLLNCYISDSFITAQRNYMVSTVSFSSNGPAWGDTLRQNFFGPSAGINQSASYPATGLFIYNNIFEKTNNSVLNTSLTAGGGFFINNSFVTPSNGTISFNCANFTFQNNIFNKANFGTAANTNLFLNNIAQQGLPNGNNNQNGILPENVYLGWNTPGTSLYSSDGRYRLKPASPAINAGILNGNAVNCGAFGGPAYYILSGMPPVPSVYQLDMPAQINSGTPSISVTISAAAH